jgi:hypothetical protein
MLSTYRRVLSRSVNSTALGSCSDTLYARSRFRLQRVKTDLLLLHRVSIRSLKAYTPTLKLFGVRTLEPNVPNNGSLDPLSEIVTVLLLSGRDAIVYML